MKKKIFRFFLVAEGTESGYPNYQEARISFVDEDPCSLSFSNSYLCSPLFTVLKEGADSKPELGNGVTITFVMMPRVYPDLQELLNEVSPKNEIWFSLGLANLIIIEDPKKTNFTEKTIKFLTSRTNITATETWVTQDGKIKKHVFPFSQNQHSTLPVDQMDLKVSDKLPLHIKFAVSEYKISANKFLTASKKFTPHYYDKHLKTLEASTQIVNDLSFLHGDFDFIPSEGLLSSLGAKTIDEGKKAIENTEILRKEELINDRNGRLIQFNSSMSYVFSQSYSGTFPLFDHTGIIQRHSLLGIGSAISALLELLYEIEEAMFFLPFEHLDDCIYSTNTVNSESFYTSFQEVATHDSSAWENDSTRQHVIKNSDPSKSKVSLPADFFNRLAFYSGRLGFREYDLSATAAIQVLVEANSLQWNIINYTHEIIHNHVRLILNQLIVPALSMRNDKYENWLSEYLRKMKNVFHSIQKREIPGNITYQDYFILILIKYCVNYSCYGSLSRESNQKLLLELKSDTTKSIRYKLPSSGQLHELILHLYKDITEIFVHVIDYCYVYSRDINTYLQSIWASWSTVTAVSNDVKQYILRTLVVIGVTEKGTPSNRFSKSKQLFIRTLEKIAKQNGNSYLFSTIKTVLENDKDEDLKNRFQNCIIVGDLAYNFFVGMLENYLDKNDKNRIGNLVDDQGNPVVYNIDRNSFQGDNIISKVRFVLDQLIKETIEDSDSLSDDKKERTSAWLLLSISSLE